MDIQCNVAYIIALFYDFNMLENDEKITYWMGTTSAKVLNAVKNASMCIANIITKHFANNQAFSVGSSDSKSHGLDDLKRVKSWREIPNLADKNNMKMRVGNEYMYFLDSERIV